MQSINDKQRRDHTDAMSTKDQEIADLRQRVTALESSAGAGDKSEPVDLKLFFSSEDIDRFGEEQCRAMVSTAVKAAKDQAQRLIAAEVDPIKQRAKDDDAKKAKEASEAFWSRLDELVGKIPEAGNRTIWEINDEAAWLEWLRDADSNGEQRQKALTRYQRELNAQGVANLVAEYLKKSRPNPPTPPVVPGGGAGNGGEQTPSHQSQSTGGKGYPTSDEIRDYSKRAATIRNPRDPRFVTQAERNEMEARLRLPRPGR